MIERVVLLLINVFRLEDSIATLRYLLAISLVVSLQCVGSALGQDWPTRPLTMVVTFPAGGPNDVVARILAPPMSEDLGQEIIVENVGGAGGMIGSYRVAKAPPDGYEFVYGNVGTHAQNQTLYKKPLYNSVIDFEPVGMFETSTKPLIVRNDLPAGTLPEFIAYARANQTKMRYGSAGWGSATHIACVLFNSVIGVNVTHIPYRGSALAMQDLIAGRIDYMCDAIQTALPQIQANTVKAIALLSSSRSPVLPNLPTAQEQGLADFDVDAWAAFFLPKGTPGVIVHRLNKAMSDALDTGAVREALDNLGVNVAPLERRSPEYLTKFVPAEVEKWAAPIRAAGISAD
jgi:tripartite-type tricarboxylate transporter receptor subunit TctC